MEDVANDVRDVLALDLGFGAQDEAVPQHRKRDGLYVFVGEEMPALQDRPRAAQRRRFSAARGLAPRCDIGMSAALFSQLDDVFEQRIGSVDRRAACAAARG